MRRSRRYVNGYIDRGVVRMSSETPLTWEQEFWANKTVGKISRSYFRFVINMLKVIAAAILTFVLIGCGWLIVALLGQIHS